MVDKVIFLTTTGAGTWTVPSDWTAVNKVESVGGGAGGRVAAAGGGGGGGGAYSAATNISFAPSGTAAVRGTTSIGYASRTNTTINKPTVQVGDWLVAFFLRGSTALQAVTPPAGFNQYTGTTFTTITDGSFNVQVSIYARQVDGSEGASFTFTHAAQSTECALLSVQGSDTITTVASLIGTVAQNSNNSTTADITVTGGAITGGSLVIGASADWGDTTAARAVPTGTNPTFTENYDPAGTAALLYIASGVKSGTGTMDNKTFECRNLSNIPIWGALIEIKAGAISGGGNGAGTVVDFAVGVGGTAGVAGGDTWFGATSLASSLVGAKGGSTATSATGGAGGASASGFPTSGGTRNSGGAGGNGSASILTGGGGGGAGGPGGTGGTGGAGDATATGADFGGSGGGGAGLTGAGGTGGAGTTVAGAVGTAGAGGGGPGGAGGNGPGLTPSVGTGVWTSTHAADATTTSVATAAPGGGGGGAGSATTATIGNGALYGGGGGGAGVTTGGTSAGTQGLIIITYTPAVSTAPVAKLFIINRQSLERSNSW